MATQILRSASKLLDRLNTVYTEQIKLLHTAATHATANNFLDPMSDVFTIMVHETDGAVTRLRAATWYSDYRNAHGTGGGPQLVNWADGTVMALVELPYRTTHGNFQNGRCVGIETGHGNDGRFGDVDVAPDVRAGHAARGGWVPLSTDTEDVAGSASAKYFALHATTTNALFQNEVVVAPWSTANYRTPARENPAANQANMYFSLIRGGPDPHGTYVENGRHWAHAPNPALQPPQPTLMLFTEAEYRSWALLTRYLCEALLVPRYFPVLPHARSDHANADIFKQIVLADEHFDQIVHALGQPYHTVQLRFVAADFTSSAAADVTNLHNHWNAAHALANTLDFANSELNLAWLRLFDIYRGIHGHGFSGNSLSIQDDHDCPGPIFDWHRYAREVWDWWWYPFDFDLMHTSANVPEREYRRATGTTPLLEYYFYDQPAPPAVDPYVQRTTNPGGIQGAASSPYTFQLEENSPVYAVANGELVAARYPAAGDVSMAFVLVRHEVFHVLDATGVSRQNGTASPNDSSHGGLADVGRIDYDQEPGVVYSLYMHLGRPADLSFAAVNDHNPDWLNRVLIRMKECDLALPPNANPAGSLNPVLQASQADFTTPPAATAGRLSPLDSWRLDQPAYRTFLTDLAAGNVAVAPFRLPAAAGGVTPIRIILGDYLGIAGVIRRQGTNSTFGLRVEVLSRDLIDTAFTQVVSWDMAGNVTRPAAAYQSEWSITPDATASTALRNIGVDPAQVNWWSTVIASQQHWDPATPESSKLPVNAVVYHYRPTDFLQWINDVTWTSEWSKYRVTGARPASPKPRRS